MSGVDKQTMDKAAELFGWAYGLGGFNVAVLEFVKFVRAQVLQQLAPELERYDIQGGDGNGVYPDKDKDGEWCKAEDALSVIGSLREAFNIKCRVDADEQAESVKLQNVLFADYRDCRPTDAGLFGWAAAALIAKAQGVVMPERKEFPELMMADYHEVRGWNACLGEVARLNAAPVQQVSVPQCFTKLLHHAHGMTLGADWNKGTMAGYHREPLGKAVVQCQAWLAAAPSPAGVGGLELDRNEAYQACPDSGCDWGSFWQGWKARHAGAQAIIDGLRGEVAEQEEAANQWRELALQFDRHRMTAMAHIRAAASGDKSAIEALGVFAALPPIPGHEITAAHERQAQRIGELEGLLLRVQVSLSLDDTEWGYSGAEKYKLLADIRAAMSAGKDPDQ